LSGVEAVLDAIVPAPECGYDADAATAALAGPIRALAAAAKEA
jgi:hypothetical protein